MKRIFTLITCLLASCAWAQDYSSGAAGALPKGKGTYLTDLPAAQLTGTLAGARLPNSAVQMNSTGVITNVLLTNYLYIPATAFSTNNANGTFASAAMTSYAFSGTDSNRLDCWAFDDTNEEHVQTQFRLVSWNGAALAAKVYWFSPNATVSKTNAAWRIKPGFTSAGEYMGTNLQTGALVTNGVLQTGYPTNVLAMSGASANIALDSTNVATDLVLLDIARSPTILVDGKITGDAMLIGVLLRYTATNSPDW